MVHNFEHRDQRGFAIEMEDDDGDIVYIGQVYGDSQIFFAETPSDVALEFRRAVDERLDADDD
jgi:hypothetical protein